MPKRLDFGCLVPSCESTSNATFHASFLSDAFGDDGIASATKHCAAYSIPAEDNPTCDDLVSAVKEGKAERSECEAKHLLVDFVSSPVSSSVSVDFGFVCGSSYLKHVHGALYMVGMLVGSFVVGMLSDRIGRLRALLAALITVRGLQKYNVVTACTV